MNDALCLTQFEETIYNLHLKVSRQHKNLPYKFRKDFASLDDVTRSTIKKIGFFLKKFPYISAEEFFIAPYKIYTDEDYFDLNYYTTLRATKAYMLYQNKKILGDPDSQEQIEGSVDSLKFILKFCKENAINLESYLKHCPENVPSFIIHLKEHRVNLYTLLCFNDFYAQIKKQDNELMRFILGNETLDNIEKCKTKLFSSKKALNLITTGLKKIQKSLEK